MSDADAYRTKREWLAATVPTATNFVRKSIDLYGDGIGRVDYVEHMGSDLTIVTAPVLVSASTRRS